LVTEITHPPAIGPERQPPAHVSARRAPLWIGLLLLLVVAAAGVTTVLARRRGAGAQGTPPPKTTVSAAAAQRGDIGVYLDAIGTVTPVYTASIASQVTGVVVAVHFTEGQTVEKGTPLVDIDPRPFLATLLQSQGALERDENVLAQARMDVERFRAAWALNAIAKQTLDDQEKLVLQTEGTVKNDRGVVEFNEVQVGFCHITSPIAGRVGLRLVDPGNLVQSTGTVTLAVVTQLEPITVVFTIPEDSLGPVRAHLRAGDSTLAVDALDRTAQKNIASGKLLTIDNQIDTTTGTVKARARFDNRDDALFPNQFVNTRLVVDTLRAVTLIPTTAIQQNGQESFVYVVADGVARTRPIKAGVADRGTTQVEGVEPGELVATSNFERLRDNTPVDVSSAPPPAPSGSGSPAP
jgi:multidrug efflux system membrane fusion protein